MCISFQFKLILYKIDLNTNISARTSRFHNNNQLQQQLTIKSQCRITKGLRKEITGKINWKTKLESTPRAIREVLLARLNKS